MSIPATWKIELTAECPHCEETIDFLDSPDFFKDHPQINLGEFGTPATEGVEVFCPHCNREFLVDLEY